MAPKVVVMPGDHRDHAKRYRNSRPCFALIGTYEIAEVARTVMIIFPYNYMAKSSPLRRYHVIV